MTMNPDRPTAQQLLLARVALGLTVLAAAELARVGCNTVTRAEKGRRSAEGTVEKLRAAYERSGVTFLADDGQGSGIRVKRAD